MTQFFQEQGDFGDDTSALLPGAPDSKPKNQLPSVFSLEFYRRCWDVTTNEVRLRVKSACYPRGDFISGKFIIKESGFRRDSRRHFDRIFGRNRRFFDK